MPCLRNQTQKQAENIPIGKSKETCVISFEYSKLTTQNSELSQAPDPDNAGVGKVKVNNLCITPKHSSF